MAFPDDETDLEVSAEFGANLATPPASLTYPDDITDYVKPYVTIKRGRLSRSATTQPTSIDMMLRNPDGTFSPLNIVGPYYGNLREQTPVRARLDPGSGMTTRGTGFVPDWPTESTGPGIDDRVAISAAGIMERLSIGQESKSALRRTILAGAIQPVGWWTFEDGPDATTVTPTVAGAPLSYTALITPGTSNTPPGASGSASISSTVDDPSTVLLVPISPAITSEIVMDLWFYAPVPTNNLNAEVDIIARGTDYALYCFMTNISGTGNIEIGAPGSFANASIDVFDGAWHNVRVVAVQAASVDIELFVDGVSSATASSATALPPIVSVEAQVSAFSGSPDGQTLTCDISHLVLYDDASAAALYEAGRGYAGEEAAVRFARLCDEEGLDHDVAAGDSQAMGPQLPGQILDLLRECELADEGVMVERLTGELGFDPVATRYNQTPAMTIPYESVQNPFFPDNSVRDAVNRATVTRIGGSSATYERATGPKGTSKATGIGTYPGDTSRSLNADSDAANHAGWLVNLGTVADPKILATLNLTHNQDLIAAWLACDIGSRIVINPPAQGHESFNAFAQRFGPAALDMILEGYEETLDAIDWLITLYLEPSLPYEAVEIQSGPANTSRIPAAGSVTNAEYGPSVTSLSVTSPSTATRWIDSATYASKFPIDIIIAGERMSCTAIVGTTATQTFTVARGSDGVTKTLPSGSEVQVYRPARIPL